MPSNNKLYKFFFRKKKVLKSWMNLAPDKGVENFHKFSGWSLNKHKIHFTQYNNSK